MYMYVYIYMYQVIKKYWLWKDLDTSKLLDSTVCFAKNEYRNQTIKCFMFIDR